MRTTNAVRMTGFLRDALAVDALGVLELEAMARAAGLLGEHQRITNAKPFRALSAYNPSGTDLVLAERGSGSCRATMELRQLCRVKPRRLRRLSASGSEPIGAFHSIGSRASSAFSITDR
jgi:hypothetical protein